MQKVKNTGASRAQQGGGSKAGSATTKKVVTKNSGKSTEGKSPPAPAAQEEGSTAPSIDPATVDSILTEVEALHLNSRATERDLVEQRIDIGRRLNQLLKKLRGEFMKEFKKWQAEEKITFSYKTGQRAREYADAADAGLLDRVSNLAEADRIVRDERKRRKEEEARRRGKLSPSAEDDADEEEAAPSLITLTKSEATRKARNLAEPILAECDRLEPESKDLLLEELIEILNDENEKDA